MKSLPKSGKRRMLCLLLVVPAFGLTACASNAPGKTPPAFPPASDLRTEAKPVPSAAIATSEVASAEYDAAIEAWGERGWAAVGRICRWVAAMGGVCPK